MGRISLDDMKKCCGCAACADNCPQRAIKMIPDNKGFVIPKIDMEKCIECGLCKSVCQYINPVELTETEETYVSSCSNSNVLVRSASGGCFYSIAESFLLDGGIVAGCAYDNTGAILSAKHIVAKNKTELVRLQGSKYVQSNTEGIFNEVKAAAKNNKSVLFCGTPCQVAACKKVLEKKYDNITYVDIICHGVPSLHMFTEYVAYLEKKHGIVIDAVCFRDKSKGWDLKGSIEYHKGEKRYKKYFLTGASSYYSLFLRGQTYRECCYECKYAGKYRCGDVTLGDYWGIEKVHPEYLLKNGGKLDETKGVSCVLVNTLKGKELIRNHGKGLFLLPSSFDNAAMFNGQLTHPSKMGANREKILRILMEQGYSELAKWYDRKTGLKRILYILYNTIPAKRINNEVIKDL